MSEEPTQWIAHIDQANRLYFEEKVETMRDKIRKIIATSIYSNPEGGFNGYDEAADKIMQLIDLENEPGSTIFRCEYLKADACDCSGKCMYEKKETN